MLSFSCRCPVNLIIPCFTRANFLLNVYPWQPNLSNSIKLKKNSLTTSQVLSVELSLKLLCHASSSLPDQYNIPHFNMANFQLDITSVSQTSQIQPNWNKNPLTTSQVLKLLSKADAYMSTAPVLRHLSVIAQPIQHSSFYNGQVWVRWLLLTAKLLKSHQIEFKIKTVSKGHLGELCLKLLRDVILPLLLGRTNILCFPMPIFFTSCNQICQIVSNWKKNHLSSSSFKRTYAYGLSWLPLAEKHLKPHQTENKTTSDYIPRLLKKMLVWSFCVTSCSRRCCANSNIFLFCE